jgi:phage gpG-like protein
MAGRNMNYSSQCFGHMQAAVRAMGDQVLTEASWKVIELTNKNFRDKGFFGDKWQDNIEDSPIMVKTGALRISINTQISRGHVRFYSNLPYAYIHNTGGKYKPTAAQAKFFWAMYRRTQKAAYKNSALKVQRGGSIDIPQRQFIGEHPIQTAAILRIIQRKMMTFR